MRTRQEKEKEEPATRKLSCRFFIGQALLVKSPKACSRQHPGFFVFEV